MIGFCGAFLAGAPLLLSSSAGGGGGTSSSLDSENLNDAEDSLGLAPSLAPAPPTAPENRVNALRGRLGLKVFDGTFHLVVDHRVDGTRPAFASSA